MNNNQTFQAIAELDGWTFTKNLERVDYCEVHNERLGIKNGFYSQIPTYFESYDAVIPLILRLFPNEVEFRIFYNQLKLLLIANKQLFGYEQEFILFKATPYQLCETILRAKGSNPFITKL